MKTYVSNNIRFRIASSNALAHFKSAQAFDFSEMSSKSHVFSTDAKEVVLLEYDQWFKWLIRLERMLLIAEHEKIKLAKLQQNVATSIFDQFGSIENTILTYPDEFTKDTYNFVKLIHTYSLPLIYDKFHTLFEENDIILLFPQLTVCASTYLQEMLFAFYEFENIGSKGTEQAFLTYTDYIDDNAANGQCHLMARAEYYKEQHGCSEFVIKNYSKREVNSVCIESLKKQGITITDVITFNHDG